MPPAVDVVAVHDPLLAARAGGLAPLVLAGHTHEPRRSTLGRSILLVEGSTGGAGLRGLQSGTPEPLTCSVLYFNPDTKALVAYDRITVEGLGQSGVKIERFVVTPASRTPSLSVPPSTAQPPTSSTSVVPTAGVPATLGLEASSPAHAS